MTHLRHKEKDTLKQATKTNIRKEPATTTTTQCHTQEMRAACCKGRNRHDNRPTTFFVNSYFFSTIRTRTRENRPLTHVSAVPIFVAFQTTILFRDQEIGAANDTILHREFVISTDATIGSFANRIPKR